MYCFNVEIVNEPASVETEVHVPASEALKVTGSASVGSEVNVPASTERNTNDEEQKNKKNDHNVVLNNDDQEESLKAQTHESKEDLARAIAEKLTITDIQRFINASHSRYDNRLPECNLHLLKPEDCLRLFDSALIEGNNPIALFLLSTGNCHQLVKRSESEKVNVLSFFIACDCVHGVEYLLSKGLVNVNAKDSKGNTPLMLAIKASRHRCLEIRAVLEHDGLITLLNYTVMNEDADCMNVLLEAGANVNAPNSKGAAPIHIAANKKNATSLNALFHNASNIHVNQRNGDGDTPLHIAVKNNQKECFMALLDQPGIEVSLTNKRKRTPLHCAMAKNNEEFIKLLREKGAEGQ